MPMKAVMMRMLLECMLGPMLHPSDCLQVACVLPHAWTPSCHDDCMLFIGGVGMHAVHVTSAHAQAALCCCMPTYLWSTRLRGPQACRQYAFATSSLPRRVGVQLATAPCSPLDTAAPSAAAAALPCRQEFVFVNPNAKGTCGCGESFTT